MFSRFWFNNEKSGASGGFLYSIPLNLFPTLSPKQPVSDDEIIMNIASNCKIFIFYSSINISMSSMTSSAFQSVSPHQTR